MKEGLEQAGHKLEWQQPLEAEQDKEQITP
jgi:hypothetical protein